MPTSPARSTPYQYIGDEFGWNSLHLTELARSLEYVDQGDLSDIFPDVDIEERTVVIEQQLTSLGLMPLVQPGVVAPSSNYSMRYQRRVVEPAYFRDADYFDQFFLNQVRKAATYNERVSPGELIAQRLEKMMARHRLTKTYFRTSALLGSINYTDPITNVSINVSSQIPAHNLFAYNNYSTAQLAGDTLAGGYTAKVNLNAKEGRNEALFFTNFSREAGVPWTDSEADFPRTIRNLRHWLRRTNKNEFTRIYMGSDLLTILQESVLAVTANGGFGVISSRTSGPTPVTTTGATAVEKVSGGVVINSDGAITNIGGADVYVLDTLFPDPNNNGELSIMWPQNKIALVAPRHISTGEVLGRTQHCMGESPESKPGLWMRSNPDPGAPNVPGMSIQMGDAFLPYPIYPHWIAIVEVAPLSDITSYGFSDGVDYGLFKS